MLILNIFKIKVNKLFTWFKGLNENNLKIDIWCKIII